MKSMLRLVLVGDVLLPGPYALDDPELADLEIMLEVRRTPQSGLPFEELRQIREQAKILLVDADTDNHNEVVDLLMLGVDRACINSTASKSELELAHAVSAKVMTVLDVQLPPENTQRELWLEQVLRPDLNLLAEVVGRGLLLRTKQLGDLQWLFGHAEDLPWSAFDLWIAPAEGSLLQVHSNSLQPRGWMLAEESYFELN